MVVRMRSTRAHRNNRRSHFALVASRFSLCKACGVKRAPHAVCEECGKYKGRQVLGVKSKIAKMEKKMKEKEKVR